MSLRDSKRITAAAIRYRGNIYTLPPPARHHDIIKEIARMHNLEQVHFQDGDEQGFLDDKDRFLRRAAAMVVVQHNNQPMREGVIVLRELYSENLW